MDSHIKNLNLNLEMLKWIQGETNYWSHRRRRR